MVTQPARQAFINRFEREVDPDGSLSPQERANGAEHARKAYFLDLALKSAKAGVKLPVARFRSEAARVGFGCYLASGTVGFKMSLAMRPESTRTDEDGGQKTWLESNCGRCVGTASR
jgi:hypothetical protein